MENMPEVLGTYVLDTFTSFDRVVYSKVERELYLFSVPMADERLSGMWVVRLYQSEISLRWNRLIVHFFYHPMTYHSFNNFFQVGPYLACKREEILLANYNCKDINFPANGNCVGGWIYFNEGFHEDPTTTIECTRRKSNNSTEDLGYVILLFLVNNIQKYRFFL